MKTLRLNVSAERFGMLINGVANELYLTPSPYWAGLVGQQYHEVMVINGVGVNRPAAFYLFSSASVSIGDPAQGAPDHHVIVVRLGELCGIHGCAF